MPKRQETRAFRQFAIRFTEQYSPIDISLALCRLSAKPRLLFDEIGMIAGIEARPEQGEVFQLCYRRNVFPSRTPCRLQPVSLFSLQPIGIPLRRTA